MRYLMLIYTDESAQPVEGSEAHKAQEAAYMGFAQSLAAQGRMRGGEALEPTSMATSVRIRNGEALVTDGPFAETREHLGGFFLIEAEHLDEAIEIALQSPTVHSGTMEIRPLKDIPRPG